MLRESRSAFSRLLLVAAFAFPALAGAQSLSKLDLSKHPRVEMAMVGFTRESAEAFRTTTAAKAPDAPAPAEKKPVVVKKNASRPVMAPVRHLELAHRPSHHPVAHEHPAPPVDNRRTVNHWPRILRNKWAGPLERIHVWWNEHFDRRHFPYPDNPTTQTA